MPYHWHPEENGERLDLWPHRALTRRGFVWFIGLTAGLIALPLLAVLGSPVLWGLLPFPLLALCAIWLALRRNGRDREIMERLTLSPERIELVRRDPGGRRRAWQANPYWIRVTLHPTGGPVPDYLTLSGGPREVEIGAFLSEEERGQLAGELCARLRALRGARD
ncbi:DUF2244 domain-containing protein [Pseudogemmobacter sonorensis]|uniref:DUF2244 domain-containing protein n=1 Tax=Pseudogemmobacter sonorensis TaxID=2989681 RepID=UPI00367AE32C